MFSFKVDYFTVHLMLLLQYLEGSKKPAVNISLMAEDIQKRYRLISSAIRVLAQHKCFLVQIKTVTKCLPWASVAANVGHAQQVN